MFRNERGLYRNTSFVSQKPLISVYHPTSPYHTISMKEFYDMDMKDYVGEYDMSKPFEQQRYERQYHVPRVATVVLDNENGDYDNFSGYNKNTYLNMDIMNSENVMYSTTIKNVKNGYDLLQTHDSELVYECVASNHLTLCSWARYSTHCYNCSFVF